uniref:Uncharacterized protein n=1 Tax=Triticum urartu TaxID=4572 RepID=A0A8R7TXR4_TRIUA
LVLTRLPVIPRHRPTKKLASGNGGHPQAHDPRRRRRGLVRGGRGHGCRGAGSRPGHRSRGDHPVLRRRDARRRRRWVPLLLSCAPAASAGWTGTLQSCSRLIGHYLN